MHSCKQVLEALSDYLDDDIAPQVRRELEAHMADCTVCRAMYDSTRKTVRIVTETRSFELPVELSESLMKKIMTRVRTRKDPSKR